MGRVGPGAKGDACEPRHSHAGRHKSLSCDIDLDRSVAEVRFLEEGESIFGPFKRDYANGFAAVVFDGFGLHAL